MSSPPISRDRRRLLTALGDANDVATWSGTPYFFLRAGLRQGFFDGGLALNPERLKWYRTAWNAVAWLSTGKPGGSQFTRGFLQRLMKQAKVPADSALSLVTHFPLLPPHPWSPHWQVTPYIDATLVQIFEEYGAGARISRTVRDDTLARERDAYQAAEKVVCMSRWAARAVTGFYGVSSDRCEIVPPGANLIEDDLRDEQAFRWEEGVLRLGFIGKDWKRKGLPALLDIAAALVDRGIPVEVVAVGPEQDELPRHELLRALGFIDKQKDMLGFISAVRSFHFGFLLSSAEALGISTLECLRLGVPVVGTKVGGIVDTIPEGLGFLFDPKDPAWIDAIVDLLESYAKNRETYASLRRQVAARAHEFSWEHVVARFREIFGETQDNELGRAMGASALGKNPSGLR